MSLLQTAELIVSVPGRVLCEDLELRIEPGQRWAILGPNGAGKSSLLHTLAGIRAAAGGRVLKGGVELRALPPRARARHIGLMTQDDELAFPSTVLEAALAGRHPHLGRWGWEGADDIALARQSLADAGLAGWEQRQVDSLSGGERRRLAIATLLTQQPGLALLDEPSNHLDLGHQLQLLDLLCGRFADDRHALVMVLHDINLALRFCDHLLLLPGDGSWQAGPLDTLATTDRLGPLYGCELFEIEVGHHKAFIPAG